MQSRLLIFCVLIILASGTSVAGSDPIGKVKTTKGNVIIKRGDISHAAEIGFNILPYDFVNTGKDEAVGIIFIDNTVLSLGPETQLVIDEYFFEPKKNNLSMIIKMLKGTGVGQRRPSNSSMSVPK